MIFNSINCKCWFLLILIILVFSFTVPACQKDIRSKTENTPDSSDWLETKQLPYSGPKIPRLTWGSVPEKFTSVERFEELKDAGITHHFHYHYSNADEAEKALEAAQQAGIKVIITCPELKNDTENTVKRFMTHPALEAYFIRDEPRSKQGFIDAGILADKIRAIDKSHFCYLNLMPGGKTNTVVGTPYETYMGWYDEYFKPEIISFDHYPIRKDKATGKIYISSNWYDNLESISEFSKDLKKPFWAFSLTVSHLIPSKIYPEPTTNHLRLQVYSNLAYGAQGIQYFTFWTPKTNNENLEDGGEHYFAGPILPDGTRTKIYDLVKKINQEIENLSFVFYGSKVKWTRHFGIDSQKVINELTNELDATPIKKLESQGGLLLSLQEKQDKQYLIVVNYELNINILKIETRSPVKRILKSGAAIQAEKDLRMLPGDIAIYTWEK